MRRTGPAVVVLFVVLAASGCGTSPENQCAAPTVLADKSIVEPGETIAVIGNAFILECNDTGGGTSTPATGIDVVLRGADDLTLASVDADVSSRLDFTVVIPDDYAAGPAELVVGDADPIPIEVVRSR